MGPIAYAPKPPTTLLYLSRTMMIDDIIDMQHRYALMVVQLLLSCTVGISYVSACLKQDAVQAILSYPLLLFGLQHHLCSLAEEQANCTQFVALLFVKTFKSYDFCLACFILCSGTHCRWQKRLGLQLGIASPEVCVCSWPPHTLL